MTEALLTEEIGRLCREFGDESGSVPNWFISPHEIEFRESDLISRGSYRGKWQNANVIIMAGTSQTQVSDIATRWFRLDHPHVVGLYGACHIGNAFYVCEDCTRGNLLVFLKSEEGSDSTWRLLHEAALGLQYLHRHEWINCKLQCSNFLVGSDFKVKIANLHRHGVELSRMAPEQIDVHLSIARDGNRIQPDDPSVESDIYSFGMCILEATSRQIWKGANGINYPARVRNGNLLKRPGCLDDDQWGLILRTCARNKRDRVGVVYIVNQLARFATASGKHQQVQSETSTIEDYYFLQISGTIKSALDGIHSKLCSSKVLWMQEKVHPALEVIYEILVEQERQPNDHVVKKYCTLLVEVRNHLRMGVSEESLAVIARSQHVAETHNGIYSKLDGLLDILEVQDNDPVRSWRQDSSDFEKRTLETGSKTATSEPSASNQTVSIIWFNNPPQDTLSSHSHPALRELGWFHPLSDVSFGESDKIGGGDFGEVCKGIYSGTAVIVKFMGYEGDSKAGVESTSTALFLHEVQVWSRLKHPHIIRFYGANHVDKRFFVCEFAPNGAIRDCAKRPESSIRERWQKMYEVALGLQHMHERGIVHNDLKCDNILIGANGDAKIIDFGLSCILSEAEIKVETKHIGAAHWRSPEYLRGERVTAATDVYSLAMCIIELMTDDIPWGCKLLSAAVKYKVLQKSIPNRPDIFSDKQWALIKQTTAFEPSERVRISVVADKLYYIVQASETATAAPSAGTQ